MNVSDYIIRFLTDHGVDSAFMVPGGQAMYLNDAVARSKKITPICHHHEQAAGMAAEAYGRVSGKIGVAMVTAGPASINVLNGVVGAWVDSAPMLVLSGQSAFGCVDYMEKTHIRQHGLQGIYIKPAAQAYTKFFVTVDDPANILYYLEKAFYLATTGRPGPVWLDVPLDIQRMEVLPKLLRHFEIPISQTDGKNLDEDVGKTLALLYKSKRPLLVVGQGVRIAHAADLLDIFLTRTRIPIVTSRLGIDLVDSDSPLFIGRPGLYGDRAAHFAVQTADFILALGARLDAGIIGYNAADWGRHAAKVIVDIDQKELDKPGIQNALRVQADVKQFMKTLASKLNVRKIPDHKEWNRTVAHWKKTYPTVLPSYAHEHPVNSYFLSERISRLAGKKDVVVVDTSSPFHVVCQAWKLKKGQRFITTGGISTMGYWVAAIGACIAKKRARTIVVTGDGCLQMNIQEFATLKHTKLPIKVFVIANNGYLLIRQTQKTHMEGRFIGESPKSGLWCPDAVKVAKGYGLSTVRITSVRGIDKKIREVLESPGPVICSVDSPQWQLIIPRISSVKQADGSLVSKPYEDLYPFLDPTELADILHIAA